MVNNCRLTSLVFSKKNHAFWLTTALLTILVAIMFSVVSILNFHQAKLEESRGNVYGYFYSILYQLEDEFKLEPNRLDAATIQVKKYKDNDFEIRVGTHNELAKTLMYRGWVENFLPKLSSDHCVITDSIASDLNKKLGDTLNLLGKDFLIENIVPDIGFLWVRGEREENLRMNLPNIWLKEDVFNRIANNTPGFSYQMMLLNYKQTAEILERDQKQFNPGNLYENYAITKDKNLYVFRFPDSFYRELAIALFVLVIVVLVVFHRHSRKRYFVYADLGLDAKGQIFVERVEYLLVFLPALIIGTIVAGVVTFLFTHYTYEEVDIFSIPDYFAYLKTYILVYFVAGLLCLVFYTRSDNSVIKKTYTKAKMQSLPIQGKIVLGLTGVLFLMITYMIMVFAVSVNAANSMGRLVEFHGQVSQKFDYELKYVPDSFPPGYYLKGDEHISNKSDSGHFLFIYYENGHNLDLLIPKIEAIEGVSSVLAFYDNPRSFIQISSEVLENPFLSRVQRTSILPLEKGVFKDQFIGENISELVACDLFLLPDSYIKDIAEQMGVEEKGIKEIVDGNTVLLISPSLRIVEVVKRPDGEGIGWERSAEGTDLLKDERLPSYKNVTVYVPQADASLAGIIPQEDLIKEGARLQKLVMPVQACTYDNLGWFPISYYNPAPYRIIASVSYLEKQSLKFESTRVNIFIEDKADPIAISNQIHKLTKDIPSLEFKDQHYNLKVWHEFKILEKLIVSLYASLFAVLIISFIVTIVQSNWLSNESRFSLYRDLGITKYKMFKTCFKPVLLSFFVAFIIQLLLDKLVFERTIVFLSKAQRVQRILIQLAIFLVYLMVFALVNLRYVNKLMKKQDYTE